LAIDRLLQKRPDDRPADAAAALALLDDARAAAPQFGPRPAETTTALTAPVTPPAAVAASFEDEYTAAFGRQRSVAMTAFAVGAVALCATAIVVVTAFPEWLRPSEDAASQKDYPVERAQTDAFVT